MHVLCRYLRSRHIANINFAVDNSIIVCVCRIFVCHRISIYSYQCACAWMCCIHVIAGPCGEMLTRHHSILSHVNCTADWNQKTQTEVLHLVELRTKYASAWSFDTFLSWMVIYECHISQTHTQNECNARDLIKSWIIECVCVSVHTHITKRSFALQSIKQKDRWRDRKRFLKICKQTHNARFAKEADDFMRITFFLFAFSIVDDIKLWAERKVQLKAGKMQCVMIFARLGLFRVCAWDCMCVCYHELL